MGRVLHPIAEIQNIGYLSGGIDKAVNSQTHAVALMARPVNLLEQGCTCFASGTCSFCRAYIAIHERQQQILELIRAAQS
jgi:hypothetical protein